ncbi:MULTISPECIES: trans-aconitate 2-methyltransferase [unclassified Rhizobium]|uniref:trans-aconitate 2-methyltransferase n=1 Tax=unclassified Rhizobium TaxID=2613769 RepID=UPI001AD9C503|nr:MULTISPECIES: trans-aconitate 2-methyltransferase [unclassified Rhizobium]MBO9123128.1 trans-aconitate 2-methyltransferase [Rhizobium sp. 16-488-2b]MBO9173660.1 trans-aconitate 2-methyltransferase [Rhizobium sp. 16-488-2a]
MAWSASQYVKFEDERTRPARDLLAQVPMEHVERAIDLGCGPGNSTELIIDRYGADGVSGLDSDLNMLEAARKRLPGTDFLEADLATWQPKEPVDLLFANAVFQWLPNHLDIFDRLMDGLKPGGALAVQMPDNLTEPTHLLMEETAHAGPWKTAFEAKSVRRNPLPPPSTYYSRLIGKAKRVDIWHTAYNHPMADAAAIVEWVKGTGLRPYLDHAGDQHREAFLADYLGRVEKAYPKMSDGRVLLRFPRLFMVAVKG